MLVLVLYGAVCVFKDKHQAEEKAIKGKVKLGAAGGKYQHCLISFIAAAIVCVSHCFVLVPEGKVKQREHQYCGSSIICFI